MEEETDTQSFALTAWAIAKLLYEDGPLLDAISSASLSRLSQFAVQSLTNTVWAFSKLVRNDEPLLAATASSALRMIAAMDPQDISNTAWAFCRQRFLHQSLLDGF